VTWSFVVFFTKGLFKLQSFSLQKYIKTSDLPHIVRTVVTGHFERTRFPAVISCLLLFLRSLVTISVVLLLRACVVPLF
jgi:hypothetical protein